VDNRVALIAVQRSCAYQKANFQFVRLSSPSDISWDLFYKKTILLHTLIKIIDLGETGWCGMNWIDLAQDREQWRVLVNIVMKLWRNKLPPPLGLKGRQNKQKARST
jgi:hypothetical protein